MATNTPHTPLTSDSAFPPYGAIIRIRMLPALVPTYMQMIDLRAVLKRTLNVREVTVTTGTNVAVEIFTVHGDPIYRKRHPELYQVVEEFLETL